MTQIPLMVRQLCDGEYYLVAYWFWKPWRLTWSARPGENGSTKILKESNCRGLIADCWLVAPFTFGLWWIDIKIWWVLVALWKYRCRPDIKALLHWIGTLFFVQFRLCSLTWPAVPQCTTPRLILTRENAFVPSCAQFFCLQRHFALYDLVCALCMCNTCSISCLAGCLSISVSVWPTVCLPDSYVLCLNSNVNSWGSLASKNDSCDSYF